MAEKPPGTAHLINPRPTTWTRVFSRIGAVLDVPLVSYAVWLERLGAAEDVTAVPALRIREFYISSASSAKNNSGFTELEGLSTEKTQAVSENLRKVTPLEDKDVESWLGYWKSNGALSF